MKLKRFYKAKNTVKRTKQQPTDQEMITNPMPDREQISKIYKELKKVNTNNPHNPIKKQATELNREFSTEESLMADSTQRNVQRPQSSEKFKSKQL